METRKTRDAFCRLATLSRTPFAWAKPCWRVDMAIFVARQFLCN
jgi:hypothetical protein